MGAHGHLHLHDHGHQHDHSMQSVGVWLILTLIGGALLINSMIAERIFGGKDHADLMAMVAAILLGAPVIWHAVKSLLEGHSHMDELVALAIIAAFALGKYTEAGAVAFFMLIAELIETRTALGARASIEGLVRITPTRAFRIKDDGSEEEIETKLLKQGERVRVRPGDNIPADGQVITGESTVNQANITGESIPVDKSSGDAVFAGTTNLTGMLDVQVSTAGKDTTLGRVQSLIADAEATKIPLMRIMERYIHWYIPTILMIALIVFYFTGSIDVAIQILVISCPCALVLATPTAMVAALSSAARLGILVKNVQELESAARMSAAVFDKTGTLTTGQLAVTKLTPAEGMDAAEMLRLAGSVEEFSKHPAAKAVLEVAQKANLMLSKPENFTEVSGRGVIGEIDGQRVMVGRESWLAAEGVDMSAVSGEAMKAPEGVSLLYVARDGKCIGWVGMEDRTRTEAREAVAELASLGVKRLVMVTGDRLAVAQRVAAEMGCTEVKAECLPHEKLQLVRELQDENYRVAVIGDGVNDAPALAAGDLGIAMGAAGSDVAINSSAVALMNNDLRRLPFLVRLSRTTRSVIWQNLIFGVGFIIIGMVLVSLELIPTLGLAAALHLISSMVIVCNSARLVRYGETLGIDHSPTPTQPPTQTPTQTSAQMPTVVAGVQPA